MAGAKGGVRTLAITTQFQRRRHPENQPRGVERSPAIIMNVSNSAIPALSRQPAFVLFWFSRLAVTISYHMLVVAISWTIYELTNSAFDLGLVGLIQFIPSAILTLLVGHATDRYDRRRIVIV